MISSHHFGSVVSLAIALLEFQNAGGFDYAYRVVENTKTLASLLDSYGFDVKGKEYGFTAGHQIWMSTNNCGIDSYDASKRLYLSGIRVNVFDELPGYKESILRIGVNEITRYGAKKEDMTELADIMHAAIKEEKSSEKLSQRVKRLKTKYRSYGYDVQNDSRINELIQKTINVVFAYR